MTLEQAAKQAMDYLDSAGVAADWRVGRVYGYDNVLLINAGRTTYYAYCHEGYRLPMSHIEKQYPTKAAN